jgi:hypothetical protein
MLATMHGLTRKKKSAELLRMRKVDARKADIFIDIKSNQTPIPYAWHRKPRVHPTARLRTVYAAPLGLGHSSLAVYYKYFIPTGILCSATGGDRTILNAR